MNVIGTVNHNSGNLETMTYNSNKVETWIHNDVVVFEGIKPIDLVQKTWTFTKSGSGAASLTNNGSVLQLYVGAPDNSKTTVSSDASITVDVTKYNTLTIVGTEHTGQSLYDTRPSGYNGQIIMGNTILYQRSGELTRNTNYPISVTYNVSALTGNQTFKMHIQNYKLSSDNYYYNNGGYLYITKFLLTK